MRTTLNIDDELYRELKVKAALEKRTVMELIETALRELLYRSAGPNAVKNRPYIKIPAIQQRKRATKRGPKKLFEGMDNEAIHRHLAELQLKADLKSG